MRITEGEVNAKDGNEFVWYTKQLLSCVHRAHNYVVGITNKRFYFNIS